MAFSIGATRAQLQGLPPVPANIYNLRVSGFKPKIAKKGDSLNYNLEAIIEDDNPYQGPSGPLSTKGKKIMFSLNTLFATALRDFVHATGNELEVAKVTNPETNLEEELFILPGFFEGQDHNPQEPEKWGAYRGPLTNATFRAEIAETEYLGRKKNDIRCFFCTIPGCSTKEPEMRHSTNLIKS